MELTRNQEIAEIIRKQVGAEALACLGAHNLFAIENGFQFKIRGSTKINTIQIILEPSDTYKVRFLKVGVKSGVKIVAETDDIYWDMLHDIIEKYTGLYVSLMPRR